MTGVQTCALPISVDDAERYQPADPDKLGYVTQTTLSVDDMKDVIAKLNAATAEALADPALQKRFSDLGLDVAPRQQQTPEGLAAFQKAEIEKWWPIIKSAGIGAQAQ